MRFSPTFPFFKAQFHRFDYFATKTGSIIVPTCGMDCIPSDLCAYLGSKTLQSPIDSSTTAWHFDGVASGGSLATIFTMIEDVPREKLRWAMSNHALSPIVGLRQEKPFGLVRKLHIPYSDETLVGGRWFMSNVDRAIVQRTWGLLEYDAMEARLEGDTERLEAAEKVRYGPRFTYGELSIRPNVFMAAIASLGLILSLVGLMITPVRVNANNGLFNAHLLHRYALSSKSFFASPGKVPTTRKWN